MTNQAAVGQRAPDFSLVDVNPASGTTGQTFTREAVSARGAILVLAFHDAGCFSCLEQGEAARAFYAGAGSAADVVFAAVNGPSSGALVADYVDADTPDVEGLAPPSTWPYLQDTAEADVWGRYCADSDLVVVVGAEGIVRYLRPVNFKDDNFVTELEAEIDRARNEPWRP